MKKGEDKGGQGDGRKEYQCLSSFVLTLLHPHPSSSSPFSLLRIKFRLLTQIYAAGKNRKRKQDSNFGDTYLPLKKSGLCCLILAKIFFSLHAPFFLEYASGCFLCFSFLSRQIRNVFSAFSNFLQKISFFAANRVLDGGIKKNVQEAFVENCGLVHKKSVFAGS